MGEPANPSSSSGAIVETSRNTTVELPGVLPYGATQQQAIAQVQALALRVVTERLEHDEAGREYLDISFAAA